MMERINNASLGYSPHRFAAVHLIRLYVTFWTVQAMVLMAALQSGTTFVLPFVFRIPYIEDTLSS